MSSLPTQHQLPSPTHTPKEPTSQLTSLPAELQEQILHYLLLTPDPITDPGSPCAFGAPRTLHPSILSTNHTLHKIGTHILYSKNKFRFTRPYTLTRWLTLPHPSINHVILELDFRHPHWACRNNNSSHAIHSHSPTLKALHTAAPELRTLVLFIQSIGSSFFDTREPKDMADVILKAEIRGLRCLEFCGLPQTFEDELRGYLRPMMMGYEG